MNIHDFDPDRPQHPLYTEEELARYDMVAGAIIILVVVLFGAYLLGHIVAWVLRSI